MWELIRLWHFEAMEAVIDSPSAYHFVRESYVSTPARWRDLTVPELASRLEQLLNVHYRHRWKTMTMDDGSVERMLPFGFDYEWVTRGEMPARESTDPFLFPVCQTNPRLGEIVITEMQELVKQPRPGIDAGCVRNAFDLFRIDENDSWHHLVGRDRTDGLVQVQARYT